METWLGGHPQNKIDSSQPPYMGNWKCFLQLLCWVNTGFFNQISFTNTFSSFMPHINSTLESPKTSLLFVCLVSNLGSALCLLYRTLVCLMYARTNTTTNQLALPKIYTLRFQIALSLSSKANWTIPKDNSHKKDNFPTGPLEMPSHAASNRLMP